MEALAARLEEIDGRIASAATAAGRDPREITRIVVTKFHPPELVRELHGLGVAEFGENRQQELSAKAEALTDLPVHWHFIGQAQANKARAIRAVARRAALTVHSVDRVRLADALEAAGTEVGADRLDVLVQVNLTRDETRGGVAPSGVEELAAHIEGLSTLRLRGIMAVAPLEEEPAAAFARLARCSEDLRAASPDATWISAGMTGDFEEAVAIGATHLRIGSAITGNRPTRG